MGESATSDAQLLAAIHGGSPGAFDALVERYGRRVLALGTRMCRHREDVLQETLLTAYQKLGKLREPRALRTWLFRIASNQCLMRRRKAGPRREVSLEELEPGFNWLEGAREVVDWSDRPDDSAARAELKGALEDAIAELPADHRIVLLLRDIEGLSTRETADALGIGSSAVKMRLHRSRLALRDRLTEYFTAGEAA